MIKTVVTDVDGVLNTGQFLYDDRGKRYKVFGPHDNDGVKMLRECEVNVIAISADRRGFQITWRRCEDMGIELIQISESDRMMVLARNFDAHSTLFIGDGYYDVEPMLYFDHSAAPKNAIALARSAAKWKLKSRGGEGVLLEVALRLTKPTMWDIVRGRHV